MSANSETQYIFSDNNSRFFTDDDICAMFDNGMSVSLIAHKLSRVLGLRVGSCEKAVRLMLYNRSINFPVPAVRVVQSDYSAVDTASPFKPVPHSWAVGDFCLRRY